MTIKVTPPLYSQYLDLTERASWKMRGCGVASLKMMMEYWRILGVHKKDNIPSANHLYRVGLNRRAYAKNIGWRHTGLVGIAKLYGFKKSKIFDLIQTPLPNALELLEKETKKHPVIVSVWSRYELGRGGHLPVLLSLDMKKAVLLDPNTKSREKVRLVMSANDFINSWKKRFIVIKD